MHLSIGAVAIAALAGVSELQAQRSERESEAALFLLLPIGARAVGMGHAVVAEPGGSEAVWWNPAGIARVRQAEATLHHSQSFVGRDDALSVVIPSSRIGALALSVNILDLGEQEVTARSQAGQVPSAGGTAGTIMTRNFAYMATFATTLGSRVTAGVTYKIVQMRVDCSGLCYDVPTMSATTNALDFGTQVEPMKNVPLVVGIAIRNISADLQTNDEVQADELPTRLHAGVRFNFTVPDRYAGASTVAIEADLIDDLSLREPSVRFGADISFQKVAHVRTGYAFNAPDGASPSIGLGFASSRFTLDIARVLAGQSADAGQAPTYLSLRYLF